MIWFLILKGGLVAGTIGPSPLTMDECNAFASERTREYNQVLETGVNMKGDKLTSAELDGLKGFKFQCIITDKRPERGSRYE